MKAVKEMSEGELAAFVATHLRSKGIDVVLSGGSSVTMYSHDTVDLDEIERWSAREEKSETFQGIKDLLVK